MFVGGICAKIIQQKKKKKVLLGNKMTHAQTSKKKTLRPNADMKLWAHLSNFRRLNTIPIALSTNRFIKNISLTVSWQFGFNRVIKCETRGNTPIGKKERTQLKNHNEKKKIGCKFVSSKLTWLESNRFTRSMFLRWTFLVSMERPLNVSFRTSTSSSSPRNRQLFHFIPFIWGFSFNLFVLFLFSFSPLCCVWTRSLLWVRANVFVCENVCSIITSS